MTHRSPAQGPKARPANGKLPAVTFPVVEIFESLQGEGYNTGKPVVFVRFGGCNLACPWCDTDFARSEELDIQAILARVEALVPRSLVVTGGEPLLHPGMGGVLGRFKERGYWVAIETNGLLRIPEAWTSSVDYVSVSPKACYAERYDAARMARQADEVRIVVEDDVEGFCRDMRRRIDAPRYYLSPRELAGQFNWGATLRLLGVLNEGLRDGKWQLSIQTHKLADIR